MRRILVVIVCFALLCSCGRNQTGTASEDFSSTGEALPLPDPSEFVFAVSPTAGEQAQSAAEHFCREIERIMEGAITATVRISAAPDADLITGQAHIAFLNESGHLSFNKPLSATAMPFLYTGYTNFTMRANAKTTLDILDRNLRSEHSLVPLAAFYQGALHLLTNFPAAKYQDFDSVRIAVADNIESMDAFARLGGDFTVATSDAGRVEQMLAGEVAGAEVSLAYLADTEIDFSDPVYLTVSYHSLAPLWLVVNQEYYDTLTGAQQAQVAELCASMTNMIDDYYLELDQENISRIDISNLTISTDFAAVRNRVFNTLSSLDENTSPQRRIARELIGLMRRTA